MKQTSEGINKAKALWAELNPLYRKVIMVTSGLLGLGLYVVLSSSSEPTPEQVAEMSPAPTISEQPDIKEAVDRNDALLENLKRLRAELIRRQKAAESAPPVQVGDDADIVRTVHSKPGDEYWIPLGTVILIELQNKIVSSQVQTPVIGTIPYTLRLDESKVIENASRFIGSAQANYDQKRVFVHFHHMITPDFKEVEIDGEALDPYGAGGLSGQFQSNELERLFSMFGLNLVTGVAEITQERKQSETGIPFRRLSAQNLLFSGLGNTAKSQSEQLLGEASTHKDEKIEIKGRTFLKLFFNRGFYSHASH